MLDANANTMDRYCFMNVEVTICDEKTDDEILNYTTDLANSQLRRVFAEQMINAYAGGQYSIVVPLKVVLKDPAQVSKKEKRRSSPARRASSAARARPRG